MEAKAALRSLVSEVARMQSDAATTPVHSVAGDSQKNGFIERGVRTAERNGSDVET